MTALTNTDILLNTILHRVRNVEAIAAAAATNAATAANQSRPRLGWIPATLVSIVLVTFVFPVVQKLEVPYVSQALEGFDSLSREAGQKLGILYGTVAHQQDQTATQRNGIHPDLMSVYHRANEYAHKDGLHIHIREGLRTTKRQAILVKRGFSRTMNSRHLDGHALDLTYQYSGKRNNKQDWEYARKINKYMEQAAKELGIKVEWGGYWPNFPDGFHWQLPWSTHKKSNKAKAPHKRIIKSRARVPALSKMNQVKLLQDIIQSESSGDQYAENQFGMLGYCQVTAATLAQIGLVKRSNFDTFNAAKKRLVKADGEPDINKQGELRKQFLANSSNWLIKGGKNTYMSTRKIQLKACTEVLKVHTGYGIASGALDGNSTQQRIAGYVKAAQFGHVRANAWYLRAEDLPDGNGKMTSTFAKEGEALVTNQYRRK